jgi:hypothetical protein
MFRIIPKDKAQALRIKRHLMADMFVLICWLLAWIAWKAGLLYMSGWLLLTLFGCNAIMFGVVFIIIRYDWNRRFKDPSLTVIQICIANFWATVTMVYTQELRGGFLFVYMMTILFGVFQLSRTGFFLVSMFAISGYAGVILMDAVSQPPKFNLTLNIVLLLVLAFNLFWLSFIGTYIKSLREKFKSNKLELEKNNVKITRQRDSIHQAHHDLEIVSIYFF